MSKPAYKHRYKQKVLCSAAYHHRYIDRKYEDVTAGAANPAPRAVAVKGSSLHPQTSCMAHTARCVLLVSCLARLRDGAQVVVAAQLHGGISFISVSRAQCISIMHLGSQTDSRGCALPASVARALPMQAHLRCEEDFCLTWPHPQGCSLAHDFPGFCDTNRLHCQGHPMLPPRGKTWSLRCAGRFE